MLEQAGWRQGCTCTQQQWVHTAHSRQPTLGVTGGRTVDSRSCHVSTKFSEIVTMFGEGQGLTGVRAFPEYCENCKISLTALAGRTASHSHLTASPMLNAVRVASNIRSDQIDP